MALDIIDLEAGQGKRMRSGLPKVLHALAGRPLLRHVIDTANLLGPRRIFVVHGHGADQVHAAFEGAKGVEWVLQGEQLGTGHAVQQAISRLAPDAEALILMATCPSCEAKRSGGFWRLRETASPY